MYSRVWCLLAMAVYQRERGPRLVRRDLASVRFCKARAPTKSLDSFDSTGYPFMASACSLSGMKYLFWAVRPLSLFCISDSDPGASSRFRLHLTPGYLTRCHRSTSSHSSLKSWSSSSVRRGPWLVSLVELMFDVLPH